MYLMEVLGKLSDAFATVDGLSAFHYYGSAIEDGLDPGAMAILAGGGHRARRGRLRALRAPGRRMTGARPSPAHARRWPEPSPHGAAAAARWSIAESDAPLDGDAAVARDGRALAVGTTCDAMGCAASLATYEPGGAVVRAGAVPGRPIAFTPLRDGAALLVTTSPQRGGSRPPT